MRNTKKLIAVIMTIAILASMMVPALAASNTTQFEALKAAGLMLGTGEAVETDLAKPLNRIQGFVLVVRAMGVEATAAAMTEAEQNAALATVEDADMIPAWGRPHAAYAVANGLTNGVGGAAAGMIKFAPTNPLTGLQFITMMLRAMNYTGVTLANCVDKAIESGMLTASQAVAVATKASFLRDDAALVLFSTVKGGMMASATGVTPGATKLIDALVAAGAVTSTAAVAFGYVAPTPAPAPALTVSSIVANNLKTVVVNFNQEVDKDSVTADTLSVTGKDVLARTVSNDKKSVTLVMDTAELTQSLEIEVVVDGVKNAAKTSEIKEGKLKVVVTDTSIPQILGVTVKNAKFIEITVSEPINYSTNDFFQVVDEITIGGLASIAKVTPDHAGLKLTVEFNEVLAAGTYALVVKDMVDFAGYKAVAYNASIVVPSDTTAAKIASARLKTSTVIEVTFNESLKALGTFTVNGNALDTIGWSADDTDKTIVDLTYNAGYGIAALAELKIVYKDQEDIVGNKTAESSFVFKVTDDTTLPTASISVGDGNTVTITFTKAMKDEGTIRLLDKDSKVLDTFTTANWDFADSNNNKIELDGTDLGLDNVDVAKYFIKLSGMKDATVRANALAEVSLEFTAKDTKNPTVSDVYKVTEGTTAAKDTVTFYFSEAMDDATLKNLSNYVNEDTGISLAATSGTSVSSVASDKKSIVIVVPDARDFAGNSVEFTVYALKDLAGNMVVTNDAVVAYVAADITVLSAKATAKNKFVITFSTDIKSVDPGTLVVYADGAATSAYASGITATIDGDEVTYVVNRSLPTTAVGDYELRFRNFSKVVSPYGDELDDAQAAVAPADEIRPEFSAIAAGTPADDEAENAFSIKVTEEVIEDNVLTSDFVITAGGTRVDPSEYTIAIEEFDGNFYIVITFDAGTLDAGTQELTVAYNSRIGAIVDVAELLPADSNLLVSFSGKTVSVVFAD